jgi:transcriptional regulator with XRE-family HTH domain
MDYLTGQKKLPSLEESLTSVFADRLRVARMAKGITQAEAAKRAGIQPAAWSHFETNQRTPCIRNLRAICIAVDVSADHLLEL